MNSAKSFHQALKDHQVKIDRLPIHTLQVNVGKLCNQACRHCHVEAGPKRTEIMEPKTLQRILYLLEKTPGIKTVDVTGGAPELNSGFRTLVSRCRELGKEVIDRCNLTVFFEKDQEDTPEFLAQNKVRVVASLPCYSQENVDKQRGKGVFSMSIEALQRLNALGYGKHSTGLELSLVYNPVGAFLPPAQQKLEADYHKKLKADFGIEFNHLFCITNMPIKRFHEDLVRSHQLEPYMKLLSDNFNQVAAEGVMCRTLVSVGWDGKLYDCDFNQMLEMPVPSKAKTVWDIETFDAFSKGEIAFDSHCFGCTAGSGSSCTGETWKNQ